MTTIAEMMSAGTTMTTTRITGITLERVLRPRPNAPRRLDTASERSAYVRPRRGPSYRR
jgi:hypothetical protein